MEEFFQVLVVSSDEKETTLLQEVLAPHAILTFAKRLPEFKILLHSCTYDIVLCDWSFALGTWKDVLREVKEEHSAVPVIVFSRTAGEGEWIDVLNAGAFDLLAQPPRHQHLLLGVFEQAVASTRAQARLARERNLSGAHRLKPTG